MVNVHRNNNFVLKEFNKEAVLQHFDLPADEKLLTVVKKSFPFYWHDKREENFKQQMMRNKETGLWDHSENKSLGMYGGAYRSFEIQINGHTVLNGCLVITDTAVYELRPRFVNPALFFYLKGGVTDGFFFLLIENFRNLTFIVLSILINNEAAKI